jgi:hypothetical protein
MAEESHAGSTPWPIVRLSRRTTVGLTATACTHTQKCRWWDTALKHCNAEHSAPVTRAVSWPL